MSQKATLILLGAFAVVLGFFLYNRQTVKNKEAEPTPTLGANEVLWPGLAKEDIARINLQDNQTGERAILQNKQGIWSVVAPTPQLASPSDAVTIASELASLTVTRALTETTDLSEFGLQPPAYTFEVTKGDGTLFVVDIGSKTPVGSNYYGLRRGEANAVILAGYSIDTILPYIQNPPYLPSPTPAVSETPVAEGTPEPVPTP